MSLKVVLILANSADPDEMQQYAAVHLGLNCLPMFPGYSPVLNFACWEIFQFLWSADFFKIVFFFQNFFQEYH